MTSCTNKDGCCSNGRCSTMTSAARLLQNGLRRYPLGWLGLLGALLIVGGCSSERHLSFLDAQGPVAAEQRWHFIEIMWILGLFVALPIFVSMPWLLWRYRAGAKRPRRTHKGKRAMALEIVGARAPRYTPTWRHSTALEIITWVGPIGIVCALSYQLWGTAHSLDPYQPVKPAARALHVQAVGYNWKWLFIYPNQGIASVGVMAFPATRPVAMQLTSATVMQSLQIPSLVGQIYAMGGMVSELHFAATNPGRFIGKNTMYNGRGFYKQDFTAIAMTPEDFKSWVRKVRAIGVPLNARTYEALSQRSTRAELAAALPRAASHEGVVYFTGVPDHLFRGIVKVTATAPESAK